MTNPAFRASVLDRFSNLSDSFAETRNLTVNGTINKTGLLLAITSLGACIGWNTQSLPFAMAILIVNLILTFVIMFKPLYSSFLSQPYAFLEGIVLGGISSVLSLQYPGIITNTLILTFGTLFGMLVLYRTGIVKVNEKFMGVLSLAMFGIFFTYIADAIFSMFGAPFAMIHSSSPLSIGFNILVAGVAAFRFLVDFHVIEQSEKAQVSSRLEWYFAFGILVNLIWLYLEILDILRKFQDRR